MGFTMSITSYFKRIIPPPVVMAESQEWPVGSIAPSLLATSKFPLNEKKKKASECVVLVEGVLSVDASVPPSSRETDESKDCIFDFRSRVSNATTSDSPKCFNAIVPSSPRETEEIKECKVDFSSPVSNDSPNVSAEETILINVAETNTASNTNYEAIRMENIRRNAEFLNQLGLVKPVMSVVPGNAMNTKRRKVQSESKVKVEVPMRVQPRRGQRGELSVNYAADCITIAGDEVVEEDKEDFDIVYDYYNILPSDITGVGVGGSGVAMTIGASGDGDGVTASLRYETGRGEQGVKELWCQDVTQVYTMHSHPHLPNLVVAGGKGGNIAVHDLSAESRVTTDGIEKENPHLSLWFKGHDRWVSSCRFMSSSHVCSHADGEGDGGVLVGSASDDGKVKIWNLSFAAKPTGGSHTQQQPKLECWSYCGHGGKGIFAMDVASTKVLTGSKDKHVSVSRVSSGDITVESCHQLHAGVVKSVSWQHDCVQEMGSAVVFASGGQDGCVCVKDVRCGGAGDINLNNIHIGGVHTVQWSPYMGAEHMLLTAGYDSAVRVYDLRMLRCAHRCASGDGDDDYRVMFECDSVVGGGAKGLRKSREITTPAFLSNSLIVVPSVADCTVSIHDLNTRSVVSRGKLPHPPTSVYCSADLNSNSSGATSSSTIIVSTKAAGMMYSLRLCTT